MQIHTQIDSPYIYISFLYYLPFYVFLFPFFVTNARASRYDPLDAKGLIGAVRIQA